MPGVTTAIYEWGRRAGSQQHEVGEARLAAAGFEGGGMGRSGSGGWKRQRSGSFPRASRSNQPWGHFDLSSVTPFWTSDFQNSEICVVPSNGVCVDQSQRPWQTPTAQLLT